MKRIRYRAPYDFAVEKAREPEIGAHDLLVRPARNRWRPTAQRGLWFMVSGFASARIHAPLVAMQIRSDLDGPWSAPRRLVDLHVDLSPAGVTPCQ